MRTKMERITLVALVTLVVVSLVCLSDAWNLQTTGYVDYLPGTGLNVILSSPHDGTESPSTIPNRDAGCWDGSVCIWSHDCGTKDTTRCLAVTGNDTNTRALITELRTALCNRFYNRCPAVVINKLLRIKLDPNREVNEATFGEPLAVQVYNEYHGNIRQARAALGENRGLYIDIHGHRHAIQRAELGYLVTSSQLNSGNPINSSSSSIRALGEFVGGDFDQLLRSGPSSFGALLEEQGFAAVPSPSAPGPGNNAYFIGGYSTRTHGSINGGIIDGIQIESPTSFRSSSLRRQYVDALVNVIENYFALNYPSITSDLPIVLSIN